MRLKDKFLINQIGDQFIATPAATQLSGLNGFLKLNDVGAFIVEQLNEEIEFDKLVGKVQDHFSCSASDAETAVNDIVNGLKSNDLLMA